MAQMSIKKPKLSVKFWLKLRAGLNFIGEIYYATIFERNEAEFFAVVWTTAKNSNEVAAKNRHKKLSK